MRYVVLLLLCWPTVMYGQLELEAGLNLNHITQPEWQQDAANQSIPLPSADIRLGNFVELGKRHGIIFSLRYQMQTYLKRFESSSFRFRAVSEVREISLVHFLGPSLAYAFNLKPKGLEQLRLESGLHFLLGSRVFTKVYFPSSDTTITQNNRYWRFGNGYALLIPLRVIAIFNTKSEHWRIAPSFAYMWSAEQGSGVRGAPNHHLQLGCGFIWQE